MAHACTNIQQVVYEEEEEEEQQQQQQQGDTPYIDTWRNARVWVDFFSGLHQCQNSWYIRERNVTIRSEIWTMNIRSLGFRDIREWVILWRLILRSLGCNQLDLETLGIWPIMPKNLLKSMVVCEPQWQVSLHYKLHTVSCGPLYPSSTRVGMGHLLLLRYTTCHEDNFNIIQNITSYVVTLNKLYSDHLL